MSIALHYSFRRIDSDILLDVDKTQLERVDQIYLKFCDLLKFPQWLLCLQNLTHIQISNNFVDCVPDEIGLFSSLQYFDISENRLTDFPIALTQLNKLCYLDLSGNFIRTIPTGEFKKYVKSVLKIHIKFSEIRNMKNLKLLKLDRNLITNIPNELCECDQMFQLSFEQCSGLISIPKNLLMMPHLEYVSFKGCNLVTVPAVVSSKLTSLMLSGNVLLNCVPHEVVNFIDPKTTRSEFYMVEQKDLLQMLLTQ